MGISLALYGILTVFTHVTINYGPSIVLSVEKIPGIGDLIAPHIFGINPYTKVVIPDDLSKIIAIGIGIVFTTGVIGLISRFLSMRAAVASR
jgi:hypothetical protein